MIRTGGRSCLGLARLAVLGSARPLWGTAPAPQVVQLARPTAFNSQSLIIRARCGLARPRPSKSRRSSCCTITRTRERFSVHSPRCCRRRRTNDPDRPSFAVVTVDLRGHGDSTKQCFPNGMQQNLDAAKIDKDDVYRDGRPRHGGGPPLPCDQE